MLKELVDISNRYGSNQKLVIAGGGNTSLKNEENLWIKGSGTTLATITDEGFVKMNRKALSEMFEAEYPIEIDAREAAVLSDLMDARAEGEEHKRPSVETLLHDLFNYKLVVHTHPAMVNGLTCAIDGQDKCKELFGNRVVWIELTPPGYVLSLKVRDKMAEFKKNEGYDADIVLLQNHGIFVAGDSQIAIEGKYNFVLNTIKARVSKRPDFSEVEVNQKRVDLLAKAIRELNNGGEIGFTTNAQVLTMLKNEDTFAPLASVYTPDHMVYYKRAPLFVTADENIDTQFKLLVGSYEAFAEKYGFKPQIIAVQGLGYYSLGDTRRAVEINTALFADTIKIAVYARSFGGALFMTDSMIDFIANWEVESYRKKVNAEK